MPIRIARSERTARSCVGVRQLLAVDPEVEIVAAVADQPAPGRPRPVGGAAFIESHRVLSASRIRGDCPR